MNTNLGSMAGRCPQARSLGAVTLEGYQFEFKGCATIVKDQNNKVQGVLWEITDDCERSLDILEGYPGYYNKRTVKIFYQGQWINAMTYLMYPHEPIGVPSQSYYDMLAEGYTEHGIHLDQIDSAVDRAWKNYSNYSWSQYGHYI